MHKICIKVNLFVLKDYAKRKKELYYYSSSKEKFTKREQVLKEIFLVFTCRNAPSVQEEENPNHVGDPDNFGVKVSKYSDVWIYGRVAPFCLLTSTQRVKRHRAQNEFKAF